MLFVYNEDCKRLEQYALSLGEVIDVTAMNFDGSNWDFEARGTNWICGLGCGCKAPFALRELLEARAMLRRHL
jgi:hypothetical protein